jgi:hypothetical protein
MKAYTPFKQGQNCAAREFSWCSQRVRKGVTDYETIESDYALVGGKDEDEQKAEEWRQGYVSHFIKMNGKPRKNQVPLPVFVPPRYRK